MPAILRNFWSGVARGSRSLNRKLKWLCVLIWWPAAGHVVSMSTGELDIVGRTASYVLKMPEYELQHVVNAEMALPEAVRLEGATLTRRTCTRDSMKITCNVIWHYPTPPPVVVIRVRLHEITVPNHLHFVRATRDGTVERAIFDEHQTVATLRFMPATETTPGHWISFLLAALALGLSAARWRDFLSFFAAGVAGYLIHRPFPAAFLEVAVAVTAAYACFEALYVRDGGWRWIATSAVGTAIALQAHSAGVHAYILFAALPLTFLKMSWKKPLRVALLAGCVLWTATILVSQPPTNSNAQLLEQQGTAWRRVSRVVAMRARNPVA